MAVIRSLNALNFNFNVENNTLNQVPPHLQQLLSSVQTLPQPPSQPSSSTKTSTTSSKTLTPTSDRRPSAVESLFRSVENGLDRFASQVDAAIISKLPIADDPKPKMTTGMRTFLFGTHLRDLLLDESRCLHTHMNPRLGVPTQILKLIQHLQLHIDTPDLFRQRAPLSQVDDLRKALELERGVPANIEVAAVAIVLTQWLNQLPEPLLGFTHYQAILACQEIEDIEHRKRNLSILVQEMPWYARPLLSKLLALLSAAIQPDHAKTNHLNLVAVALLSAPWLLRPRPRQGFYPPSAEEQEKEQLTATAAGSAIVEFLITHHNDIFTGIYNDLSIQQSTLAQKCASIRRLQTYLSSNEKIADLIAIEDDSVTGKIRAIFQALAEADQRISTNISANQERNLIGLSLREIMNSGRWRRCGLSANEQNLADFNGPHALLALECFANFLDK
jgi:hypothetical protein